jgi:SepF-like predicted cell division protein (DUF552 family)
LENISRGHNFKWFEIESHEDLAEAVSAVRKSENDEVIVADYEYIRFRYVGEIAEALDELATLDEYDRELAVQIAKESPYYDISEAVRMISEGAIYVVHGDRLDKADAVAEYLDETCFFENVPEQLKNYFDYDRYTRDMECESTDFIEMSDKVIIVFPH